MSVKVSPVLDIILCIIKTIDLILSSHANDTQIPIWIKFLISCNIYWGFISIYGEQKEQQAVGHFQHITQIANPGIL